MVTIRQWLRRSFVTLLGCGVLLLLPTMVAAQSITVGYKSDKPLQRGMVVGLKKDDATKVEAINATRSNEIHGIVVASNDAAIALTEEEEKVYVAKTGKFEVLVSDVNGPIKAGDYVSLSSISGIGMVTDEYQDIVLGKSLDTFEGPASAKYLSKAKIKDGNGQDREINLGRVSVDIVVGKNPLAKNADNVPELLRKAGEAISGKEIGAPRLYLSFAMVIVTTAVTGAIIYSAVRSGIISIGRNPLSKKSIVKSIIQMVVIGFIVFFSGLFGVYLILKL